MLKLSDKNSVLDGSANWPTYLFLFGVGIFLYMFLFELPATPFFGDGDQSIFLYEAQRMLHGDVMYRDFFEFTLPGTQSFYALMFAVFGEKFWIVGATVLIIGVATVWSMLVVGIKILPSPLHFLPPTLYIFFGFRWAGFDFSHRMFSPVFVLLAAYLLIKRKTTRNLVLAGFSLALSSFFTQQRGFVVVTAIVTFFLIEKFHRDESWGTFLKSAAVISISFVVVLAGLCLYFAAAAGTENFFYSTVVYPFKYYSYGEQNQFGVYMADLQRAFTITKTSEILAVGPVFLHCVLLPFAILFFFGIFFKNRRTVDWNEQRAVFLVAITGLFLTFTTTAPNMFRLFPISIFGLIVLVWLVVRYVPSAAISRTFAVAVCSGLMLLGGFQAIRMQTNWNVLHLDTPVGRLAMVESKQAERYAWLAKNTKPGNYFFEVYEPFVYFPLGLKNPTRFGQIWPNDYTRPEHVAEAVRSLDQRPPHYILWDNSYFAAEKPRASGDHTAPLTDFVRANYSPIGEVYETDGKPIQIWEITRR